MKHNTYFDKTLQSINADVYPFRLFGKKFFSERALAHPTLTQTLIELLIVPFKTIFLSSYISQPLLFFGLFFVYLAGDHWSDVQYLLGITVFSFILQKLFFKNKNSLLQLKLVADFSFSIIVALNAWNAIVFEGIRNVVQFNAFVAFMIVPIMVVFSLTRIVNLLVMRHFPNQLLFFVFKVMNLFGIVLGVLVALFIAQSVNTIFSASEYRLIQWYFLIGDWVLL